MNGEPYYFTLGVPDASTEGERVLLPAASAGSSTTGTSPTWPCAAGSPRPSSGSGPKLYLGHADVAAGVARVRELGGTATDPQVVRSGEYADCTDDQGTRFQHRAGPMPELEDEQMRRAEGPSRAAGGASATSRSACPTSTGRPRSSAASSVGRPQPPASNRRLDLPPRHQHRAAARLHRPRPPTRSCSCTSGSTTAAAVAAEVEAPGRHGSATLAESENGYSAACHDDQGTPFSIWQPAPGL